MQCPTCNATIPNDAQFCIECGNEIATAATGKTVHLRRDHNAAIQCPTCYTANPAHAVFCVRCGQTMHARPIDVFEQQQPITPPPPVYPQQVYPQQAKTFSWRQISSVVFVLGIAVLWMTRAWWPGILLLFALCSFLGDLDSGRPRQGVQSLIWLMGLYILFTVPGVFFPGILLLVGLSALVDHLLK